MRLIQSMCARLPLRCARRCACRLSLSAAGTRALPRATLAGTPRSLRPGPGPAAAGRCRARGRTGRALGGRSRSGCRGTCRPGRARTAACSGVRSVARTCGRRAAALGPWARAGRARRRTIAALAGSEEVAPEHVAEALSYRSPLRVEERRSERARAGGVRGRARRPRGRPRRAVARTSRRSSQTFDERAYSRARPHAGFRWLPRSDAAFPPLLRRSTIRRPGCSCAGGPPASSSRASRRDRRRAQPAPTTALTSPASSRRELAPRAAWSSSRASRAGSTAGRIAARSKPAGRRSPCSAVGSTATIRAPTPRWRAQIAETGLIVSEYPPGVAPAPWRFPARNRIVAGLPRRRSSSRRGSEAAP